MTPELMSLTAATALTVILWMPYILNTIAVRGVIAAVGYEDNPKPLAYLFAIPWVRTLAFAAGLTWQAVLVLEIL